jgi:hypothetical protein
MTETIILTLISFGIPFAAFVIMYCWMVFFNRKTTAEVKWNLPPEIFLKMIVVILVTIVTFILTYVKILEISITAAILGSVVTGTITSIQKVDK